MFVFRKTWCALFFCNSNVEILLFAFEIHPSVISSCKPTGFNSMMLNVQKMVRYTSKTSHHLLHDF